MEPTDVIGNARLFHGDCRRVLPLLQDQSFDLVLADLPYGTTQAPWDSVLNLEWLWSEYRRLCRGPVILFAANPFDKILAASNLKALTHEWVWRKSIATGHLNAKRAPLRAHEVVLVFKCGGQFDYFPQMTRRVKPRTPRAKTPPSTALYGGQTGFETNTGDCYPQSVLDFPSTREAPAFAHPTAKPVELVRYLLRTYAFPGDTVLDNTMGAGTTGVAAAAEGLVFTGVELDPDYYFAATLRISGA